jgi:hypothetical protein
VSVPRHETVESEYALERRLGPTPKRRLGALALLTSGLALLAALDAAVAVGPAFALSLAAAWLFRV